MLKKITIQNYRCYNKHEIEFKNLSIIVGKNNAGKSTLVEALRLVSLALSRFQTVNYHPVPKWLELPAKAKGINISAKIQVIDTEFLFHNYGDPPSEIVAEFSNSLTVIIYIGWDNDIFCTLIDGEHNYITSRRLANEYEIPQVNILPQIGQIQKEEKILGRDYVRSNISTDLASLHFRNQLALLYESFPKFTELAEQSWSGLRIHPLEGRHFAYGGTEKLTLLVQDGGFVSEVGRMGSGLQMWLQIMWFLSRIDDNEVVILDEPDVYMHPDLQRKLIRLLRNRYKQVIVSTHSIEIISEVEPQNILIIDKEKDKSVFASKVPVVQRILNSIGSIHNLQLTKLWSSKKLVIVEGEDIDILKRIQNTMFPLSDEPFDSIPNFDIGGWGGWDYARGSNLLLKETVDDGVKVYCLFDSDYFTAEEIDMREKEAEKIGVNIHIWKRKEIENYLIVPTAILRILKDSSRKTQHLTVSDIENIISEKAKNMEDELIDNLSDKIFKNNRKLAVSSLKKIAKARIDKLEHRVCGKTLLSSISKWSQDNFKVSLNPIKLAINLQLSEIDPELKYVIKAIENNKNF